MTNKNMMCDLETGVCGPADEEGMQMIDFNEPVKTIDLYYVTDPICSHCWALEPVLRRFTAQYGHYVNVHTVMGGLLEKWSDTPVDRANGISKPADVAAHWREVGEHSRMPIDGGLWYDDPVQSSFPPSRVYKVIQSEHGAEQADAFLRRLREELFAFNNNVIHFNKMKDLVDQLGLDGEAMITASEAEKAHRLLDEDFALRGKLGARGFPTVVMMNEHKQGVKIVGARSLENYVDGLKQIMNTEALEPKLQPMLSDLLKKEKRLFAKEIEVMYDIQPSEVKKLIEKELTPHTYHVGDILGEIYVSEAE
ncbi:DsbA family protein [Bacillaceae bacterium SIJ1]|uniref:DsbA family protein n=1 Tax=Litoribacterium kuwaitense TaxID=1398745 RepID=UPI0013ED1BC3|nr:DsbA family protein [Litoribacterium kuwaitense]NGP45638.1 DsbA family protein [Litoribacterium kuwaitense]